MIIGVLREIMLNEGRVAAIPETVAQFKEAGNVVLVEKGAGVESGISDSQYAEAGAILTSAVDIWKRAQIVLKVKEPLYNNDLSAHEADLIGEGRCLVSFLHPANHPDMAEKFAERKVTAISMDCVPRIAGAEQMDALSSMSMVAGYRAIITAADNLSKMMMAPDTELAPLSGAKVLLVGFGVVGQMALKAAKGLGCEIAVVDLRESALDKAEAMGAKAVRLKLPASNGTAGGRLSFEQEEAVRRAISEQLPTADVVILSALVFGERAPILITRGMVSLLKRKSVIVDVSVDQGGNCEATVPNQIAEVDGVKIVGILNLPGQVPFHSTQLYARNIANFVLHMIKGDQLNLDDPIIAGATITRDGKIVHEGVHKALQPA